MRTGDAAALARVGDRVVEEIGEQLTDQELVPVDDRGVELQSEIDALGDRPRYEFLRDPLDDRPQVARARRFGLEVAAFGAGERQELVGEVRGALGGELQRDEHPLPFRRLPLLQAVLRLHAQPGERRAQLVSGIGDELLLRAQRGCELEQEIVERVHHRPHLDRRVVFLDRAQVAVRSRLDFLAQPLERRESPAYPEPYEGDDRGHEKSLAHHQCRRAFPRPACAA